MKTNIGRIGVKTRMRVLTAQYDKETHKRVSLKDHGFNLVLDTALVGWAKGANSTSMAGSFNAVRVGSGTNPTKFASGAITFTQSGTTVTASAGFFTSAMVGAILKYGSDTSGVEYYISSFTDSTHVEVLTSDTIAAPTVGTVWMVQQTGLQTLLYSSTTRRTDGGDNFTNTTGNVVTMQRTTRFAVQVSTYNVNEVGWFSGTGGSTVFGRIVLGSTETVNPTNYLVVIMQLEATVNPYAAVATPDVGTNVDTSGFAGLSWLAIEYVNTSGVTVTTTSGALQGLEGRSGSVNAIGFFDADPTTPDSIATAPGTLPPDVLTGNLPASFLMTTGWTNDAANLGEMTISCAFSGSNLNPATCYGLAYFCANTSPPRPWFIARFTTPAAFPDEALVGTAILRAAFSRTLDNS